MFRRLGLPDWLVARTPDEYVAAALRLVVQRGAELAYVDMRYANGFAAGWRNGTRMAALDEGDDAPEG